MADGVGFEPTESVNPRWFSRPVPSTTRPPIPQGNLIAFTARRGKNMADIYLCPLAVSRGGCFAVFEFIALIYFAHDDPVRSYVRKSSMT